MTEWADCAVCNLTTDPDSRGPGDLNTGDCVVVGSVGDRSIVHHHCSDQGAPRSLDNWM